MSLYDSLIEMVLNETKSKYITNADFVKKDETKIKSEINKQLKVFFNEEKDNYIESSGYDWRRTIKKVPTIDKFDYQDPNFPMIILSYTGSNTNHDHMLFFEDDFVRYLRKQSGGIFNRYYFYDEDYPGIYISLKKE